MIDEKDQILADKTQIYGVDYKKDGLEYKVIHWNDTDESEKVLTLISEEPLSIRVQGHPYAVIMRTPGKEQEHVAGFCLGEGIADIPSDIVSLARCDGPDANVVAVTLSKNRQKEIDHILDRREYISQSSCGICGKEVVQDLIQTITPLVDNTCLDIHKAMKCLESITRHQPLRDKTRGAHSALIHDHNLQLLSSAEDVGRHNALDKAIGALFLQGSLDKAKLLVLSSRLSYELVQKAARARIPIIITISRPTALAVQLSRALGITVVNKNKGAGLFIYSRPDRLGLPTKFPN